MSQADLLRAAGVDVDRIRRTLRRRALLLAVGSVITVVAVAVDWQVWRLPSWTSSVGAVLGGALGFGGAMGLSRGLGCLAQILALVWISYLACGVAEAERTTVVILAGSSLVAAVVSLIFRRRAGVGGQRPPPVHPEGAPAPVIDVEAREVSSGTGSEARPRAEGGKDSSEAP